MQTASETPTPTSSLTMTPTETSTQTPTPSETPTQTPTPTHTRFLFNVCSGETLSEACSCEIPSTIWGDLENFDENTQFYDSAVGSNTINMTGFYSYNNIVVELDSNGVVISSYSICPTQTPTASQTPTNTETPTNTPSETPINTETQTSTPTKTPTNTPTPTLTPSEPFFLLFEDDSIATAENNDNIEIDII
jgi:hypothetical protein